jgi:hypothetical protein
MRPGVIVSIVGHIGAVLMTMLAWEARSALPTAGGAVVPVEIVDVALESNVRALAEEVPDEEVTAAEELPTEAQEASAPAPTAPQRARQDDFNLDDIAAGLINREQEKGRRRQEGQRAERTQSGAGLGTAERVAVEDRAGALVDRHLRRCWRMPDDLPDPERLIVTLSFQVGRKGALVGQPRVVSPRNYTFDPPMAEAVNRALRAVRQCDPYEILSEDPVVGEHFEIWREQEVTFGRRSQ